MGWGKYGNGGMRLTVIPGELQAILTIAGKPFRHRVCHKTPVLPTLLRAGGTTGYARGWMGWLGLICIIQTYTQRTVYAYKFMVLLAAPLLIGCDLTQLDAFTLNLLTNDEVLAINRILLGNRQGRPGSRAMPDWVRSLQMVQKLSGFQPHEQPLPVNVSLKSLGLRQMDDEGCMDPEGSWPCSDSF